jgi:hypothetical protein
MTERAKEIYQQLQSVDAIKGLKGECEDSYFDCKEWPNKDEYAQKMLAKAACGLTNAEGGVLVIGMKAESRPKDEPDVVTGTAPVANTSFVKSKVLNLIGNLVEPGIIGVESIEINDPPGKKSGFVLIYIPASEGAPRRSRKDWRFYQRIGAGTFPMEYFQIEDMFGKRPHPKLSLVLEKDSIGADGFSVHPPKRIVRLGLRNEGRGIARFPCVRFSQKLGLRPAMIGLDESGREALPRRASVYPWIIYQGGVDSVIYDDETFFIAKLVQDGKGSGTTTCEIGANQQTIQNVPANKWEFAEIAFACQISCEGMETVEQKKAISGEEHIQPRI